MEFDRREFLTGGAATAAAAILPAFSGQATVSGVRRFALIDGPIYSRLTPPPRGFRAAVLDALWHFQPITGEHRIIRHAPTGFICKSAPEGFDKDALQAVCIDAPQGPWPNAEALQAAGCAAYFVAFHALMAWRSPLHEGAIFLRFTQADPADAYGDKQIEDAPPLAL